MKMTSRLIDLISKNKKLHLRHTSNQQTTNLLVLHAFLSFPCTTLFCTTKTSNFLVTRNFYGGIVVCTYPILYFLCSSSLLFFTAAQFSPCWSLAFLIFSPPLRISMFFFLRNSPPLFSITRSSSFSVIHVQV